MTRFLLSEADVVAARAVRAFARADCLSKAKPSFE